jgi:MFS family permease
MASILFSGQFLLIAATNFCLFLVVSTWSFLPVVIVDLGGNKMDVGLVMGSIGITSLGALPFVAPLIDRYGRKLFIVGGILVIGLTNAGFLFFDQYSPSMILVRLVQGVAFAACFNGCATSVVDLVPPSKRAQGIGFFGVSGSLAVSVGPFAGEMLLSHWGYKAYFLLLVVFGLVGFLASLFIKEPERRESRKAMNGFFLTAFQEGYISLMAMAVVFGSGFAAMNTFLPLYAKELGLQAGIFFVCYGCTLILVRLLLGQLTDRMNRDRLIFVCLLGFGFMLISNSQISSMFQTGFLGAVFGVVQGLSYPSMMARMVDRSSEHNRAVVVALFTGSFGVGINLSVFAWGIIADASGLSFMFVVGGMIMLAAAAISVLVFALGKANSLEKAPVLETKRSGSFQ